MTTFAQNCEPSLRTRQPSSSKRPICAARPAARARASRRASDLRRVERREMLADDFARGVALDPLRPFVPGGDVPVRVEQENRVVPDAFDQQPEALFALAHVWGWVGGRGGLAHGARLITASAASGLRRSPGRPQAGRMATIIRKLHDPSTGGDTAMKLYYHPASTTSRTVMLFAAESGIPLEMQVVDLFTGEHIKPPYSRRSIPNRLVPVLEDGDFALTESSAILKYLADKTGSPLYPKDLQAARPRQRADGLDQHPAVPRLRLRLRLPADLLASTSGAATRRRRRR